MNKQEFSEYKSRELCRFPRENTNEHPAIDHLRHVHEVSRIIACLLDDAQNSDESDHAEFLEQVAREAAQMMLQVAEDALRALPNNQRDRKVAQYMEQAA